MTTPQNVTLSVPFNSIVVKSELNSRSDLPGIEALADNIREHGLIQPLVVEKHGEKYLLRAGYRRAAALKLLKWGSKEIPVVVTEGEREIVNLTENLQRADLHPSDLAQRLHDLAAGTYDVPKGEEPRVYERKELAKTLGLSLSHVSNLIRSHAKLGTAVKRAWRTQNIPTMVIFHLASLDDEDEQERELSTWLERKAKYDEVSKRSRRKEVDAKKNDGPIDHSDKTEDEEEEAEVEEVEETEERPAATRPSKRTIVDTLLSLKEELDTANAKETAIIKAKVDTLRWVIGELKRFPKGAA